MRTRHDRGERFHASDPYGKRVHIKDPISSSRHLVEKYSIHMGEAESIQLALDINALLLINERDGRNAAKNEGVKIKGTIGILFEALRAGIIDRGDVLRVLSIFRDNPHDFWMDPDMIGEAIKKLGVNE